MLDKKDKDEFFMKKAFEMAQIAYENDEMPVGAVIVNNGQIIAKAHNQTELLNDFTAHAEMIAFTSASEYLGNKYLDKCILYVTLEPCVMCAGASFWTRINRIVFGAYDKKRGFSQYAPGIINEKKEVLGGIMEDKCADLINQFFKNKRQ